MNTTILPCSFDNYSYLLVCDQTGEAAVVDPAEYYPISCEIEKLGVKLKAIYCTHHHADHIGGLEDLIAKFPEVRVYGFEGDKDRIKGLNSPLKNDAQINFGKVEGRVFHTPGHTTGSVCYQFKDQLFTGDTLFGAGCGRLFEGGPHQMYEALNVTIKTLSPDTLIYFGHEYTISNLKFAQFIEPENKEIAIRISQAESAREKGAFTTPSTLQIEIDTNPFLRCDSESVVKAVAKNFMPGKSDPVSVFTQLRRLKDSF